MRPHIRVRLRPGVEARDVPYWGDVLEDKDGTGSRVHPDVDRVLREWGLDVLATREFRPAADGRFTTDETASGLDRVYRLILMNRQGMPEGLVEQIRLLPAVEDVREGRVAGSELPPLARSLGRSTGDEAREAIGLPVAHRFSEGRSDVTVAVLDTGVVGSHPELQASIADGMDFVDIIDGAAAFIGDIVGADPEPDDEVGHGTHVAGITSAEGRAMPRGVAPRCRVLPVRVLATMVQDGRHVGAGLIDNIDQGIKYAVDQGVDVINLSLGVQHDSGGLPHREVIDYAARQGVTVVAASGNDGGETLYYPGALRHVIAVGAVDPGGRPAHFSTYGPQVTMVAPGTDIYSCAPPDDYATATGTSHAAPFVAGAVALLRSYARDRGLELTDRAVKHLLVHTADRPGRAFKDRRTGFGALNLADAVRLLDHKLDRHSGGVDAPAA